MPNLKSAQWFFYCHSMPGQPFHQLDGDTDLNLGIYLRPSNEQVLSLPATSTNRDNWTEGTAHGPLFGGIIAGVTVSRDQLPNMYLIISIRPRGLFGSEGNNTWQYFDAHMRLYWDDNITEDHLKCDNLRLVNKSQVDLNLTSDMSSGDTWWGPATKKT